MALSDQTTVAVVQMTSGHDRDANVAKATELIAEAATNHGADLVVLPEFFNIEYVFTQLDRSLVSLAEPDDGPTIEAIRAAARRYSVSVIATIFEDDSPGVSYDTAMIIDSEGVIRGKYRKTHPAATESLEKIFFRHGSKFDATQLGHWGIGINICYDNEIPESARCSALNGADMIVAPFATPLQMPLREMMIARACDNQVFVAVSNKVGREGSLEFCGLSMLIDPYGNVLASASSTDEGIVSATFDRSLIAEVRHERPLFRDRRPDLYAAIITATEDLPRRWRPA